MLSLDDIMITSETESQEGREVVAIYIPGAY